MAQAPDEARRLSASAAGLVLLLSLFWAGNPIAIKLGLADAPPLAQGWMRFAIGGAVVIAWGLLQKVPLRVLEGEAKPLIMLGLLFTVQVGMLNLGVANTTAANAAVLLNTFPLHIAVLAHFFVPGDRLDAKRVFAVLVCYAGVVIIFVDRFQITGEHVAGDLLCLGSAMLLGGRNVFLNRSVQKIHPVRLLLAQVAFGVPLFFLASTVSGEAAPRASAVLGLSILYQGVIVAGFNFLAILELTKIYRPSSIGTVQLSTPLFGILLSRLILQESMSPAFLLGSALVVGGIAFTVIFR